ncbi:MAG: hypothetical protein JXB32_02465 [Deltaproteobacteria bacterium]|nr:hypothetical protein [Deltaproteobacteria bacterium]
MTGWGREWVFVVAAAVSACGPPPVVPAPAPEDATAVETTAVEPTAAADEPFRAVLAALVGGSARAVRNFVPTGGRLLVRTDICSGPLGRVRCNEHEVDAERRMVTDELLAPWQGVVAQAAAADPAFAPETQPVRCAESAPPRWTCSTVLSLGFDACRGDHTATLEALLLRDGDDWWLEQLGLSQEILVCH